MFYLSVCRIFYPLPVGEFIVTYFPYSSRHVQPAPPAAVGGLRQRAKRQQNPDRGHLGHVLQRAVQVRKMGFCTERDTTNDSSTALALHSFFHAQERLNCHS